MKMIVLLDMKDDDCVHGLDMTKTIFHGIAPRDCTSKNIHCSPKFLFFVFHFMKKTMKHVTKLTLTSTTPEHIGLTNRPRVSKVFSF